MTAVLAAGVLAVTAAPANAAHYIGGQATVEIDEDADGNVVVTFIQLLNPDNDVAGVFDITVDQVDDQGTRISADDVTFDSTQEQTDDGDPDHGQPRVSQQTVVLDQATLTEGHRYVVRGESGDRISGIENAASTQYSLEASFTVTPDGIALPPRLDSTIITRVAKGYAYSQNLNASDPHGGTLSYDLITETSSPHLGAARIPGMTVSDTGQVLIPADDTDGFVTDGNYVFKVTVANDTGDFTQREIMLTVVEGEPPAFTDLDGLEFEGEPFTVMDDGTSQTFEVKGAGGSTVTYALTGPSGVVDDNPWVTLDQDEDDAVVTVDPDPSKGAEPGQGYSVNLEITDDHSHLTVSHNLQLRVVDEAQTPDHLSVSAPAELSHGDDAVVDVLLRDADGYRVTTGELSSPDVTLATRDPEGGLEAGELTGWSGVAQLDRGGRRSGLAASDYGTVVLTAETVEPALSTQHELVVPRVPSAITVLPVVDRLTIDQPTTFTIALTDADGFLVDAGAASTQTVALAASPAGAITSPTDLVTSQGKASLDLTGIALGPAEVTLAAPDADPAIPDYVLAFDVERRRVSPPTQPPPGTTVEVTPTDGEGEHSVATVETSTGDVRFDFQGAHRADPETEHSTVSVTPVDDADEAWTRGLTMLGQRFAMTTDNLDFDEVEICIPIDKDAFADGGRPQDRLRLLHTPSDAGERDVTTRVTLEQNVAEVCGRTDRFSEFQVAVYAADRVFGADRYETAAEVAAELYPSGAGRVFVASGERHPDGLVGGVRASMDDAPLLLTGSTSVPSATLAALDQLAPDEVVIVGGTAAVSEDAARTLAEASGAEVSRESGDDRYATAVALADRAFDDGVGTVYLATGETFPDALTGGAAALADDAALLLTATDELPAVVAEALEDLAPERIVVVGGSSAISDDVVATAGEHAAEVVRAAGATRYETSARVAEVFTDADGTTVAATGEAFPDALVGTTLAGRHAGPVLLVRPDAVPEATVGELERLTPERMFVLGGEAAIGPQSELTLTRLLPPFVPDRL